MPRYRFAWSNLPPRLLKQLASDLGLRGDPAEELRRQYGARPKAVFVQQAWPTLLEAWLPGDAVNRQFIAEELRALGLGKGEMSIRGKQGQLDYLRSCRNAPTLRDVVLAAFLAAGETVQLPVPAAREAPTEATSRVPTTSPARQAEETPARRRTRSQDDTAAGDLNEWIEATLKQAYELDEVKRDSDGDIPIPRGSAVLFIRPHDGESPFLEIFAPMLHDFQQSPQVYEAVNAINGQVRLAKAIVSNDGTSIVMQADVPAHTLSPPELLMAVDLVSAAADHFDTLLQKRFGGSTMIADDDDAIDV